MSRTENQLLLIDPYKNLLQAYSLLLGQLGFSVDTALNLQEAQGLLSQKNYSLIVSELIYPQKACLNFWQEIKKENADASLIVLTDIFLTDQDYQVFFDSGADDLVGKPCSPERLLIHIRRGLHYRELKVAGERMKNLALMDPLTKVAQKVILNSAYFRQSLRQELKKARRHQEPFSLVMVNTAATANKDNHIGEFICEVAGILGKNTREEDLLGRERQAFGLILPRTGKDGSRILSDRLTGALQKHPPFQEGPFRELLENVNFETFTYPDQTDFPEPYSGLLSEKPSPNSLQ